MNRRVLVVEDDPSLARLVKLHLSDLNCRVDHQRSMAQRALEKFQS